MANDIQKFEGPCIFDKIIGACYFSPIQMPDLTAKEQQDAKNHRTRLDILLKETKNAFEQIKPYNLKVEASQLESEITMKKVYLSFEDIVYEVRLASSAMEDGSQANTITGPLMVQTFSQDIHKLMERLMKQYQQPQNSSSLEIMIDPVLILMQLGAVNPPVDQKAIDSAKKIIQMHQGAEAEHLFNVEEVELNQLFQ